MDGEPKLRMVKKHPVHMEQINYQVSYHAILIWKLTRVTTDMNVLHTNLETAAYETPSVKSDMHVWKTITVAPYSRTASFIRCPWLIFGVSVLPWLFSCTSLTGVLFSGAARDSDASYMGNVQCSNRFCTHWGLYHPLGERSLHWHGWI